MQMPSSRRGSWERRSPKDTNICSSGKEISTNFPLIMSTFDRGQFLHRVFLAFEELRVISSVLFELSNPSNERVLTAMHRSAPIGEAVQFQNAIGGSCCRRIFEEADRLDSFLKTNHQLMMQVLIPVKSIGGWRIQWSPTSANSGGQWVFVIGSLRIAIESDGTLADQHVHYTRLLVNGLVVDCSQHVAIDGGEVTKKIDAQLVRLLHSHLSLSIFKFWTTAGSSSSNRMLQTFAGNKAVVIDDEKEFHIELIDDWNIAYSTHPKSIEMIHDVLTDSLSNPSFYSF